MIAAQSPAVGVGVIIEDKNGNILLGKRCGSHAPYWALPGGKMELGESFEQTAAREIFEETGLSLLSCQLIGLTNNLQTYRDEGVHFISAVLLSRQFSGQLQRKEPQKCESWQWFSPNQLPQPLFEASQQAIQNWLSACFYTRT